MAKLTFRREARETGLSAVGNPYASVEIKRNRRVVGRIQAPSWQTKDGKWGVGFMVTHGLPDQSCDWSWVFFKARHDTEEDARAWVLRHADAIQAKYELREEEED